MVLRPRIRHAVLTAALGALIVPATAGAAVKTPVITKVTPKIVNVGDTLLVQGRNFRVGRGKNTLLFKRDGGKALFAKAGLATSTKITIVVPKTLEKFMAIDAGKPTASRFRLRVLTTKLSKTFTATAISPVIGPEQPKSGTGTGGGGAGGGGAGGGGSTACPVQGPNGDDDGDLLTNFEEASIGTNPCKADTDGDGVWDSFEYWSAVDLNGGRLRPERSRLAGKRLYPNPLDGSDANTDYDGDVVTLAEEFARGRTRRYGNEEPGPELQRRQADDGRRVGAEPGRPGLHGPEQLGQRPAHLGQRPDDALPGRQHDGEIDAGEVMCSTSTRDGQSATASSTTRYSSGPLLTHPITA